MSTRVVLVDLSSIAHPAWHVHGAEADPNATSTAIIERVRALASAEPHVGICCDAGKSFRADIDPTYKAQRETRPAALYHQIDRAIDVLKADGFPVWRVTGFEADDLIASATVRAVNDGDRPAREVLILSADKDLLQLVGPRVSCFSTASSKTYDEAAVELKFGVRPNQMGDYLALVGDASDNIKGAEGIGAKTAAKILARFGNLDDLYAVIDTTDQADVAPPAAFRALLEFRSRLATVRELIALRTDVPIPFDDIFKPRVPNDVAEFGDDIAFAMPTLEEHVSDATDALEQISQPEEPEHELPMFDAAKAVADWAEKKAAALAYAETPNPKMKHDSVAQSVERQPEVLRVAGSTHAAVTTHANIAAALAKAQGAIQGAIKDSNNPFFNSRYADLASVWEACRAPLSANGIAVVQLPETKFIGQPIFELKQSPRGERVIVKVITNVRVVTRLLHESGESIESVVDTLLPTGDPQSIGSAITYLRRYALSAMVGVAPEDDDGEAATRIAPTADQRQSAHVARASK